MTWSMTKLDTMTRMWADGDSAAAIGRAIGMTRNAVLGKAHRLKLPTHAAKVQERGGRPRKAAAIKSVLPLGYMYIAKVTPTETPARPCSLLELDDDRCRWPEGDTRDTSFHFCGAQPLETSPYCLAHYRMAYRAPNVA